MRFDRAETSSGHAFPATFLALLGTGLLGGCLGWAAVVLASASWSAVQPLNDLFPFYKWRTRVVSAAEYAQVQRGLAISATVMAGLFLLIMSRPAGRREARGTWLELRSIRHDLRQKWRACTPGQRNGASWALIGFTLGRLYFSLANPEYDDAVSYELFVSKGLLATSAYYPLPNNHVFSNTIAWLFYQVNPGFWWSMRLPVLLISTAASIGWFLGLLRLAGFRVALVAVALFSGLQLSWYHAGVGRGYWLLIAGTAALFFSMLEILRPGGRIRAAWLVFTLAGALGLYTVPTFAYVVASAGAWLVLRQALAKAWPQLMTTVAGGLLLALAAGALYAPLLLVSGLGQLAGNGFVAALRPADFLRGFPAFLWHSEGFLAGQRTLGSLVAIGVLLVFARAWQAARQGKMPALEASRLHRLLGPCLWFMVFPYVVAAAQRVYPPERVLLYKGIFLFILAGFALEWALRRWPRVRFAWAWRLLAIGVGLYGIYQAYSVVRVNPTARATNGAYRTGLEWLARHPAGPILIPEPTHNLFFRFYAHTQQQQRPWRFDYQQQPHVPYRYVVAFPNRRGYFQPEFPFAPAYHNAEVDIYEVPANFGLASQAWYH
ncbi:MAG: hypothetical protein M3Y54_15420 [Bacteroidota bacterium]|nr:hypothetical protein [Bacteroidota bacterium]